MEAAPGGLVPPLERVRQDLALLRAERAAAGVYDSTMLLVQPLPAAQRLELLLHPNAETTVQALTTAASAVPSSPDAASLLADAAVADAAQPPRPKREPEPPRPPSTVALALQRRQQQQYDGGSAAAAFEPDPSPWQQTDSLASRLDRSYDAAPRYASPRLRSPVPASPGRR